MSTLRDVSLELARMEREMKKKEEEYNKQKAKPLVQSFSNVMENNPEFCEKIMQFTKEDVRAIAGWVIKNGQMRLLGNTWNWILETRPKIKRHRQNVISVKLVSMYGRMI